MSEMGLYGFQLEEKLDSFLMFGGSLVVLFVAIASIAFISRLLGKGKK